MNFPITNVDLAPTFIDLACDGNCCDTSTGLCEGGASNASDAMIAPFDGRSLMGLLGSINHTNIEWRKEVFIE